jgi:hypothetical protein
MAYGKNPMTKGKARPSTKPLVKKPAPPKAAPKPKHKGRVASSMANGGLQLNHQLWRLVRNPGGKRLYEDGQALWDACIEYFDWIDANKLKATEVRSYEGQHDLVDVPKMRAMTRQSLCVFLDISISVWDIWKREREDLQPVIEKVEAIIFANKFEGAAAGLLNAGVISRELGLIDKRENTGTVQVTISGDDADL